jgi:hypothetical protein
LDPLFSSVFCYNESTATQASNHSNDDLNTFLNEYFINDKHQILNRLKAGLKSAATDELHANWRAYDNCLDDNDSFFSTYDSQTFPSINLICANNKFCNMAVGLKSKKRTASMSSQLQFNIPQVICTNPNKYCKYDLNTANCKLATVGDDKLSRSPLGRAKLIDTQNLFKIQRTIAKRRNTIDTATASTSKLSAHSAFERSIKDFFHK